MRKAYLMNIEGLPKEEAFALVPSWRREKAERLRFEKDIKHSLGAWLLLMYAIKKEGLSCGEVAYTERGKPYFTEEALPRFCLSHAGSYVLCAIADEEVGCDVQDEVIPSPRMIDRICTQREKQQLYSAQDKQNVPASSAPDGALSRLRARSRFGSECPQGIHSLPNRASRPQGEGQTVLPLEGKLSAKPTDEVSDPGLLFASLWAKKESLVKLSGAGMAADLASLKTPPDPCLLIDRHAVYACTKNGGFPRETTVVGIEEVLAFLRT